MTVPVLCNQGEILSERSTLTYTGGFACIRQPQGISELVTSLGLFTTTWFTITLGLKILILLLASSDYKMTELNKNIKYGNSVFDSTYSQKKDKMRENSKLLLY